MTDFFTCLNRLRTHFCHYPTHPPAPPRTGAARLALRQPARPPGRTTGDTSRTTNTVRKGNAASRRRAWRKSPIPWPRTRSARNASSWLFSQRSKRNSRAARPTASSAPDQLSSVARAAWCASRASCLRASDWRRAATFSSASRFFASFSSPPVSYGRSRGSLPSIHSSFSES